MAIRQRGLYSNHQIKAVGVAQLNRLDPLAVALLLVGVTRHYGWLAAEPALRGIVSKALGALATLALLFIIRRECVRSNVLTAVLAWYAFEETQTAACSIAYAIAPWPLAPGQPLCSALLGFDIGAVSIFIVGLIAYHMVRKNGT